MIHVNKLTYKSPKKGLLYDFYACDEHLAAVRAKRNPKQTEVGCVAVAYDSTAPCAVCGHGFKIKNGTHRQFKKVESMAKQEIPKPSKPVRSNLEQRKRIEWEAKKLMDESMLNTKKDLYDEPRCSLGIPKSTWTRLKREEAARVRLADEPVSRPDPVNNPSHYTQGKIEPIDVIEDWKLGFCLGNAVKYIARSEHKGSKLEDLKKAAWYLAREIERLEKC
jgi:hypothetical protein